MAKGITLPDIPEHELTPVVKVLLGIIENLVVKNQKQEEEIEQLKDEVAILKAYIPHPSDTNILNYSRLY